MFSMRRMIITALMMLLATSLMAGYGTDRDIGLLSDVEKGSADERVVSFFMGEYSLERLEEHVQPQLLPAFTRQYGEKLASWLPLENVLISKGKGVIKLKDTSKGVLLDVFYNEEGLITSIGIR